MPNFVDKPDETIKYIWQSRQPGLPRPFLWASMLNMARFKAQFNHDFPLSNGMEHGAVCVRPKNGSRFIDWNSRDFQTQVSPKLLSSCVLFYLVMHYLYRIEGKRDTSLSVRDRSFVLVLFCFVLFFFFNATPRHRATPLSRSSTDPFFNATPWHRAILLSRSAIVCVASASVRFRSKEREPRVKHRAKK